MGFLAETAVAIQAAATRGGHRHPMHVQSLLFARGAGWTPARAKKWAREHGYRYGKVHVTFDYVRLRQHPPKKGAIERTIFFGDGIKAIVER